MENLLNINFGADFLKNIIDILVCKVPKGYDWLKIESPRGSWSVIVFTNTKKINSSFIQTVSVRATIFKYVHHDAFPKLRTNCAGFLTVTFLGVKVCNFSNFKRLYLRNQSFNQPMI